VAVTGDATLNGDLTVVGTGPHVIGASSGTDYSRLTLDGAFTSGGASARVTGLKVQGELTAVTGDTTATEGAYFDTTLQTQASETIGRVTQVTISQPGITKGSGATVTNSASLYVAGASDQASNNYSIWVPEGNVLFGGNLVVTGSLSKGSGSFRIRHPLPAKNATHELVHSFIEGPQCDLIYRGSATLVAGSATVNLDTASNMTEGTWVLLCRDEQVFTSNETGWSSVRGSVSGNILTIECQEVTSTDTISWMVVAERHDEHIKNTDWTDTDGRPIVEPEKAEEE
jgi:hypothetical protein